MSAEPPRRSSDLTLAVLAVAVVVLIIKVATLSHRLAEVERQLTTPRPVATITSRVGLSGQRRIAWMSNRVSPLTVTIDLLDS